MIDQELHKFIITLSLALLRYKIILDHIWTVPKIYAMPPPYHISLKVALVSCLVFFAVTNLCENTILLRTWQIWSHHNFQSFVTYIDHRLPLSQKKSQFQDWEVWGFAGRHSSSTGKGLGLNEAWWTILYDFVDLDAVELFCWCIESVSLKVSS